MGLEGVGDSLDDGIPKCEVGGDYYKHEGGCVDLYLELFCCHYVGIVEFMSHVFCDAVYSEGRMSVYMGGVDGAKFGLEMLSKQML